MDIRPIDKKDLIELHVGGRQFIMHRTTFSNYMSRLNGNFNMKKKNRFYIDCDAEVFTLILEYFRVGKEVLVPGPLTSKVLAYAKRFRIEPLRAELETMLGQERENMDKLGRKRREQMFLKEIYNVLYHKVLEKLNADLTDDQLCLPLGIQFRRQRPDTLESVLFGTENCVHAEEFKKSPKARLIFNVTDVQYERLPPVLVDKLKEMGYKCKEVVCKCKADARRPSIYMIIALSEDQMKVNPPSKL